MTKKLPADAFQVYVSLGDHRSYQAVADQFGVSKRAVVTRAVAEGWADRLLKIETDARVISDKKLVETLAEMQERHAKMLRVMGARVVVALREFPLESCMDAVRAAEVVIKLERLAAGEVSKRTEVSVEEITRREVHALLTVVRDESPRLVGASVVNGADDAEADDGQGNP